MNSVVPLLLLITLVMGGLCILDYLEGRSRVKLIRAAILHGLYYRPSGLDTHAD